MNLSNLLNLISGRRQPAVKKATKAKNRRMFFEGLEDRKVFDVSGLDITAITTSGTDSDNAIDKVSIAPGTANVTVAFKWTSAVGAVTAKADIARTDGTTGPGTAASNGTYVAVTNPGTITVNTSGLGVGTYNVKILAKDTSTGNDQIEDTAAVVIGSFAVTVTETHISLVVPAGAVYSGAPFSATATVLSPENAAIAGQVATLQYYDASNNLLPSAPTNAGTYSVVATYGGVTSVYSAAPTVTTPFTIAQAPISYTIAGATHVYGSTASLANDSLSGVNGETLTLTKSSAGNAVTSNVGNYAITGVVTNGTGLASNYAVTLTNGNLAVTQALLTVNVGNASKVYGATATNLATVLGTTVLTGVNGENLAVAYSSNGNTPTAAAGGYALTGIVSDGSGLLSNYSVTVNAGVFTVNKATLAGLATTQDALNIAKQGSLTFALNNITGLQNGDTLASILGEMAFTLKIGENIYSFAPSVSIDTHGDADPSNDTVNVAYSLKAGSTGAALLAADLQALNAADGFASTSASNASVSAIWVNMSSANYTFSDDALTRLFSSAK
jgi:hypothetical protein